MGASAFQVNSEYPRSVLLKNHESQLAVLLIPDSASRPQAWGGGGAGWIANRKNDVCECAGGPGAIKGALGEEGIVHLVGDSEYSFLIIL